MRVDNEVVDEKVEDEVETDDIVKEDNENYTTVMEQDEK